MTESKGAEDDEVRSNKRSHSEFAEQEQDASNGMLLSDNYFASYDR